MRNKAEKLKHTPPKAEEPADMAEMRKLVHELRVQQVELRMQNEELLQSRRTIEELAEQYTELYDFAPLGYFTLSMDGEILGLNIAGSNMLGYTRSQVINSRFLFFVSQETKPVFHLFLDSVFASSTKETCEITLATRGSVPMVINLTGIVNSSGRRCLLTAVDITELKKAGLRIMDLAKFPEENENPDYRISNDGILLYANAAGREFIPAYFPEPGGKMAESWCKKIRRIFDSGQSETVEIEMNARIFSFNLLPQVHENYVNIYGTEITAHKIAEASLLKSEKRYKVLFENSIVGMYTSTLQGKFLYANSAQWKMLEFESFDAFIHADVVSTYKDKEQRKAFTALIRKERQVFNYELDLVTAKGNIIQVLVNAFISGDVITGMMMDVTKRKVAETRIILTSRILHLLNEPISLADSIKQALNLIRDETGTDAIALRLREGDNYPYFYHLGFEPDFIRTETSINSQSKQSGPGGENHGKICLDCTCGLVISGRTDNTSSMFTRGGSFWTNISIELLDLAPEQDPRHNPRNRCIHDGFLSFALVPIRTQVGIVGLLQFNCRKKDCFTPERISFFESIGEIIGTALMRKQAEDEIRNLNTSLEQRVDERTVQLQAANKEMEAFSYSVSHDLRAPLRGIHGFTQILVDEYSDKLDPEGKRICSVIQDNSVKMGRLIDDLLAFSRLVRADVLPAVIEMNKLVRSIFLRETESVSADRITFELGDLHDAPADPAMLRQVWTNLMSNAIKYSSKIEKAVITVSSVKESGVCTYCIRDNGAGFSMEHVDKLFNVFQRLHNTSEFEGTGVGLAIVQRIIQRHGGAVWAEGAVNSGAAFYFTLPSPDRKN